jgi:hypothetical protein
LLALVVGDRKEKRAEKAERVAKADHFVPTTATTATAVEIAAATEAATVAVATDTKTEVHEGTTTTDRHVVTTEIDLRDATMATDPRVRTAAIADHLVMVVAAVDFDLAVAEDFGPAAEAVASVAVVADALAAAEAATEVVAADDRAVVDLHEDLVTKKKRTI